MNVVIRDIGNSKGIIIPSHALKEAGIGKDAVLSVEENCIIVKATAHPRAGWLEAIQKDPATDSEPVFMDGLDEDETTKEWTW